MRKFLYTILTVLTVSSVACSPEALDTYPAASLSSDQVFANAAAAQSAVDGIYGLMYSNEWTPGWHDEKPGLQTVVMSRSLMGEDHFMADQGSGWFYFDYAFWIDSDWTSGNGRQAGMWEMIYTFIAQANYVIDNKAVLETTPEGMDVLGQAYAIRAYSYYCLYECFCQGDYTTNNQAPGVPIYTGGTDKSTEGVGRGTIEQLFTQIYDDFAASIACFEEGTYVQSHPSHIDYYAANGLWARAALGRQDYTRAMTCAEEALKKPGLTRVASLSALTGFNNRAAADVLWAFEITADQVNTFGSFVSLMAQDGTYGASAPQCVDYWLYEDGMTDDDLRRAWATPVYRTNTDGDYPVYYYGKRITVTVGEEKYGVYESGTEEGTYFYYDADDNEVAVTTFEYTDEFDQIFNLNIADYAERELLYYWQNKFQYQNASTGVADVINMRAEEMLLTLAECYVVAGREGDAKNLLSELYEQRYSTDRDISALVGDSVSPDTHSQPVTLMDEVLLQRRIELWCESVGRVADIRRLKLSVDRDSRQPREYPTSPMPVNAPEYIYAIPQTEFDSNPALDLAKDQN